MKQVLHALPLKSHPLHGIVPNEVPAGKANELTPCYSRDEREHKKGGAVVFFAVPGPEKQVPFPINGFWTSEVRILTSYYCGPEDIAAAMDMLASGGLPVDDLVTHRLPLEKAAEGFRLVLEGKESIKVIIKP